MKRNTRALLDRFIDGVQIKEPEFADLEQAKVFADLSVQFAKCYYCDLPRSAAKVQDRMVMELPEDLVFYVWDEIGWIE